jgi:hypothetical protein
MLLADMAAEDVGLIRGSSDSGIGHELGVAGRRLGPKRMQVGCQSGPSLRCLVAFGVEGPGSTKAASRSCHRRLRKGSSFRCDEGTR